MLRDLDAEDIDDLCPQCREKTGVMDLQDQFHPAVPV